MLLLVVLMVALSTAAPRYVVKREAIPPFYPVAGIEAGSVDDYDDDISPDSSALNYPYSFGWAPYGSWN